MFTLMWIHQIKSMFWINLPNSFYFQFLFLFFLFLGLVITHTSTCELRLLTPDVFTIKTKNRRGKEIYFSFCIRYTPCVYNPEMHKEEIVTLFSYDFVFFPVRRSENWFENKNVHTLGRTNCNWTPQNREERSQTPNSEWYFQFWHIGTYRCRSSSSSSKLYWGCVAYKAYIQSTSQPASQIQFKCSLLWSWRRFYGFWYIENDAKYENPYIRTIHHITVPVLVPVQMQSIPYTTWNSLCKASTSQHTIIAMRYVNWELMHHKKTFRWITDL